MNSLYYKTSELSTRHRFVYIIVKSRQMFRGDGGIFCSSIHVVVGAMPCARPPSSTLHHHHSGRAPPICHPERSEGSVLIVSPVCHRDVTYIIGCGSLHHSSRDESVFFKVVAPSHTSSLFSLLSSLFSLLSSLFSHPLRVNRTPTPP